MIRKIWKNKDDYWFGYWFGYLSGIGVITIASKLDNLIKRGERVLFKEKVERGEIKFYDVEKCSDTSVKFHPIKIVRVSFDVDDVTFIDRFGGKIHTTISNLFSNHGVNYMNGEGIVFEKFFDGLPLGSYINLKNNGLYIHEDSLNKEED